MIAEIRKQAESGNQEAQYQLGQLYYTGEKLRKNYKAAFEWFGKAAESGHASAQRMVAEMFVSGKKIGQNKNAAFYWMQCAAMQGDIVACERLAGMYLSSYGCFEDKDKAIELYMKAALSNNSDAQYHLGMINLSSDIILAKDWLNKAASSNHPSALYELGRLALKDKDIDKAEYWFKKLYMLGTDPIILGREFLSESILDKAEQWFEIAAQEDEWTIPFIANDYEAAGVYEKKFEWRLKMALKGDAKSQYEIGKMHERGTGTPVDLNQAICWFQKAIDSGYENLQDVKAAIRRVKKKSQKTEKIMTRYEDDVLHNISKLSLSERVPVMIFTNASIDCIIRKLKLHVPVSFEDKCENCLFSVEEYETTDEIIERLFKSALRINGSLIDYKLSEECIKKEGIKFIFFDTLPASVDKKEIIKWGQEIGVYICFTEFHFEL